MSEADSGFGAKEWLMRVKLQVQIHKKSDCCLQSVKNIYTVHTHKKIKEFGQNKVFCWGERPLDLAPAGQPAGVL